MGRLKTLCTDRFSGLYEVEFAVCTESAHVALYKVRAMGNAKEGNQRTPPVGPRDAAPLAGGGAKGQAQQAYCGSFRGACEGLLVPVPRPGLRRVQSKRLACPDLLFFPNRKILDLLVGGRPI